MISASDSYFDLVSAPPQLVLEARRYFITGGEDNFKALARLLAKAVGILDILHKAAVEAIKQLISLPRSEEAIMHVVESVLQKLLGGEPRFQTMR